MKTRIEGLWEAARSEAVARPLEKDGFRLVRYDQSIRAEIFCGVDGETNVLLAFGVMRRPPSSSLSSASLDYFRKQRHDGSWLMVLRLRQAALQPVFGRLCQDLVDAVVQVETDERVMNLVLERLGLWKRLFQKGDGLLEEHEVRGLIAELLTIEHLLDEGRRSSSEIVSGWVGPTEAEQDFVFPDQALEVKSISPGRARVTISSLDQLSTPVPLRLVVRPLKPVAEGTQDSVSLNSLVARIEGRLSGNAPDVALFRERLLEGRYVEHEGYDKLVYVPDRAMEFEVREGFPRLLRSTVAAGIAAARYELTLDALAPFSTGGAR